MEFLEFGTSWSLPAEGLASRHFWYLTNIFNTAFVSSWINPISRQGLTELGTFNKLL